MSTEDTVPLYERIYQWLDTLIVEGEPVSEETAMKAFFLFQEVRNRMTHRIEAYCHILGHARYEYPDLDRWFHETVEGFTGGWSMPLVIEDRNGNEVKSLILPSKMFWLSEAGFQQFLEEEKNKILEREREKERLIEEAEKKRIADQILWYQNQAAELLNRLKS